ncbi:MAG: PhzF family phenazine biosynthesis protein [Clostridia bacterium]|nr:PhzF family phenazine biosynthesis protein [Clostridia bacterium]
MRYFTVDAFTDSLFSGNPAGICLLDEPLPDKLMQRIAGENNLPETAFIMKKDGKWSIRWFTPAFEMDLCGHATLASGFVVLELLEKGLPFVEFSSASGPLRVARDEKGYTLDFPSRPPVPVPVDPRLSAALGAEALECALSRDLIILVKDAETVKNLSPDFALLREITGCAGFVPTAEGSDCDFVSRYFDPNDAIIEDPATGSAHCSLIPFWKEKLNKTEFCARQLSARGGTLYCRDAGDRVFITGNALLYLDGTMHV